MCVKYTVVFLSLTSFVSEFDACVLRRSLYLLLVYTASTMWASMQLLRVRLDVLGSQYVPVLLFEFFC